MSHKVVDEMQKIRNCIKNSYLYDVTVTDLSIDLEYNIIISILTACFFYFFNFNNKLNLMHY